ncbi:hypothetical protein AA14337_0739 [Acetobacter malorum DSM 14337]|uniref:Phage related protein n=1 Tax=Acetobacter malorum DSM 14337 TaxID=1307910 RepID=A0ABQ0PP57_9PROT|nr:hypothetical protein [Acetobacter malorum]GBQ77178.1 hypothetical protein AA14337_0739 [Acetobacter malorum DSM 14337]
MKPAYEANPKYELTDEQISIGSAKLFRIRALRTFSDVQAGDLGGFVETDGKYEGGRITRSPNLSHDDDCWLYDDAKAFAGANVNFNAKVSGQSEVFGRAIVGGESTVADHTIVDGLHGDLSQYYAGSGVTAMVGCLAKAQGVAEIRARTLKSDDPLVGQPKYELTDEQKEHEGSTVYRIRAVRDFELADGQTVKAGELGGWVESYRNLSHVGGAWIADNAAAMDLALVCENALMKGQSCAYGQALARGQSLMDEEAIIADRVVLGGRAELYGRALLDQGTRAEDSCTIGGDVHVSGGWIGDDASLSGSVRVTGSPEIGGQVELSGSVQVTDNAVLQGNIKLSGKDRVGRDEVLTDLDEEDPELSDDVGPGF